MMSTAELNSGASDAASAGGRAGPPQLAWLKRLLFDRRGNASRPKIVFMVFMMDVLIVAAAGIVAAAALRTGEVSRALLLVEVLGMGLAVAACLNRNWAYTVSNLGKPQLQAGKIVRASVTAFCIVIGLLHVVQIAAIPPAFCVAWLALAAAGLLASRIPVAAALDRLTRTGSLVRRTIIVGADSDAGALIEAFAKDELPEVEILGVFDDRSDERSVDAVGGYPKLGNFEQMSRFVGDAGVDLLIITIPMAAERRLLQILKQLMHVPVDIRISAHRSELKLNPRAYSYIGNVPMLAVMDRPLTDWDRVVKNLEDRVLGSLLLLLAAPVMALVALAIRLDSKGPIFFKQRRYGFNNELIEVYKFRSMFADMGDATANRLVTRDDARVTRVGRFIRRTSLDELPQLFNVLRGEMSLVGPRPHATEAKAKADLYQAVVAEYFSRHRVKPGVTGWAQFYGWRGVTDTHEKLQR
ncbi:MAG: exopolysaccharide biosynthesis polyprenyl glycosylphosphotransferase, partial [Hyphomicrobiaceae bacterium]